MTIVIAASMIFIPNYHEQESFSDKLLSLRTQIVEKVVALWSMFVFGNNSWSSNGALTLTMTEGASIPTES
jgi:hypothetical protein